MGTPDLIPDFKKDRIVNVLRQPSHGWKLQVPKFDPNDSLSWRPLAERLKLTPCPAALDDLVEQGVVAELESVATYKDSEMRRWLIGLESSDEVALVELPFRPDPFITKDRVVTRDFMAHGVVDAVGADGFLEVNWKWPLTSQGHPSRRQSSSAIWLLTSADLQKIPLDPIG